MEAAALIRIWEQAVERLIPPASAAAVLGDLRESCANSGEYVREIFKIAPFVIVSQAARHLNMPVLILQVALIYYCWGGWAATLAMPVLMLREAYQPLARPDPQKAMRVALLLAFSGLLLFIVMPVWIKDHVAILFTAAPLSLVLCAIRTGVIVSMDRLDMIFPQALSLAQLAAVRDGFLARLRWRRRFEAIALALAALFWPGLIGHGLGLGLAAIYLAAALYLLNGNLSDRAKMAHDFIGLRAAYVEEVSGAQQLSRFLCWLWVVPGLMIVAGGIVPGLAPEQIISRAVLVLLLCFGAGAINREGRGQVQEEISQLSRLRETVA
jgi:hypothetical protein